MAEIKKRTHRYAYDVYLVNIPEDFGTMSQRLNQAIVEADERAHLYAVPAVWRAYPTEDPQVFRVVRKRFRNANEQTASDGVMRIHSVTVRNEPANGLS